VKDFIKKVEIEAEAKFSSFSRKKRGPILRGDPE
jgi:hypothetical protein